jgi:hypothetical protein
MLAFVFALALQDAPGDPSHIQWVRPFKDALARAKETGRPLFVKPILGGSNTPKKGGTVAGGKDDCDGSW